MPGAVTIVPGPQLADRISSSVPDSVEETAAEWVRIRSDKLVDVSRFLHDDRKLDGRYLSSISGVDRYDCFEAVYHITSLSHKHQLVIKVRAEREEPIVPSVVSVWQGANLQEREVYDLLGVQFSGHPSLKRILLWEGFPGHPLRKDFMSLPDGLKPGLRRFPKEDPEEWGGEFRGD